jgi:hypothetical protein
MNSSRLSISLMPVVKVGGGGNVLRRWLPPPTPYQPTKGITMKYVKVQFSDSAAHITTPGPEGTELETVCSTVEETNAAVLSYILENFPQPQPVKSFAGEGGAGDVDPSQR